MRKRKALLNPQDDAFLFVSKENRKRKEMIKCLMPNEFPWFTHPRIRGRDLPMPRFQPEFSLSVCLSCSLVPRHCGLVCGFRRLDWIGEGMDLSSVNLYETLLSTPLHAQLPALS